MSLQVTVLFQRKLSRRRLRSAVSADWSRYARAAILETSCDQYWLRQIAVVYRFNRSSLLPVKVQRMSHCFPCWLLRHLTVCTVFSFLSLRFLAAHVDLFFHILLCRVVCGSLIFTRFSGNCQREARRCVIAREVHWLWSATSADWSRFAGDLW